MIRYCQKIAIFLTLLVLLTNFYEVKGKPRPGPAQNALDRITGCEIDSKLQETCQRCAKRTKSNVVYPMCCSNEDEVYIWCKKYMGFGIH